MIFSFIDHNSYFYDGNRQKKLKSNLISSDYGDKWEIFDVISCCIDLDNCTVSFYRNDKFLGVAFDKLPIGSGIVYFPVINLAYNEKIIVNFGSNRFKYPIEGYQPLEIQNQFDIVKSNMLIEWLFNLILCQTNDDENIYQNVHQEEIYQNLNHQQHQQTMNNLNQNPFFYLTTSLIIEHLENLLTNEFIIETCLFKHLIIYHTKREIHCFLEIIWSLFNETNLDLFFNSIVLIIVYGFQFSQLKDEEILYTELNYSTSTIYSTMQSITNEQQKQSSSNLISFANQKQYLYLFLILIEHKKTRSFLLSNVLFKKNLLFQLIDTKLILDNNLLQKHLFPNLNLQELRNHFNQMKTNCNDADSTNFRTDQSTNIGTSNGKLNQNQIWRNIEIENTILNDLQSLQIQCIDVLIFQDEVCRSIFIDKFTTFLTELERQFVNSNQNTLTTPLSVLSLFHR